MIWLVIKRMGIRLTLEGAAPSAGMITKAPEDGSLRRHSEGVRHPGMDCVITASGLLLCSPAGMITKARGRVATPPI